MTRMILSLSLLLMAGTAYPCDGHGATAPKYIITPRAGTLQSDRPQVIIVIPRAGTGNVHR